MVIKELGRGFFFVLLVVYGGFAVSLILFPVMFLLFIPSKTVITFRNWFIQSISSIYQEYLAVILQYVGGVNTIIHCESNLLSFENTGVIIFSNHRTVVDWMFVGWSYCSIINKLSTLKVMLKEPLRSVPIFGSIMQMLKFIFLHRKREKDIPHITRILSYLIKLQTYPTILIFPEGTDLSPSNVIKSNTYGDANGLPACQYVLRPKALGALTVLNTVSNFHTNYVVHDITMAYVDHTPLVRPSPISLLLGRFPVEVHLLVEVHNSKDLPKEKEGMDKWLSSSYLRKEQILKSVYEASSPAVAFRDWPRVMRREIPVLRPVLFMSCCMSAVSVLLWVSLSFRYLCVVVCIVYVTSTKLFDGLDNLELELCYEMFETPAHEQDLNEKPKHE